MSIWRLKRAETIQSTRLKSTLKSPRWSVNRTKAVSKLTVMPQTKTGLFRAQMKRFYHTYRLSRPKSLAKNLPPTVATRTKQLSVVKHLMWTKVVVQQRPEALRMTTLRSSRITLKSPNRRAKSARKSLTMTTSKLWMAITHKIQRLLRAW